MKHYCTVIFFITAIAVTLFTPFVFSQQNVENKQEEGVINLSVSQLKEMTAELKYYDEVLTASVLNYAVFNEKKSLDRYNEYEPKLTQVINQLLSNKRSEDLALISTINHFNQLLVSLEIEAIESVHRNNKENAQNILNGTQYKQYKAEYTLALTRYLSILESRVQSNEVLAGDKNTFSLTAQESKWITNNKVIVGIEYWPPIMFMSKDNTPSGLSGELFKQVIDKTGLQVEYVTGTWEDLLTQFKKGEIDVLPDAYFFEERKEFGHFSKPYFMVRELFYVNNNATFQSNIDLAKATIAIPSEFTTIGRIKALYPDINIIETTGLEGSVDKVLSGEADALIESQVVIDDFIRVNNITGLRVIDEDAVFPSSLHFYTTKKKTTLHNILVKGLRFIKNSDHISSHSDWLENRNKALNKGTHSSYQASDFIWVAVGAIILLLVFGVIISTFLIKTNEKELVTKFSSSQFKRMVISALAALSVILIMIVFFIDKYAERRQFETLEYNLQTLLTTSHQRLKGLIKYELYDLEHVGQNKELVELVDKLLHVPAQASVLKSSPLQSQIRQFFQRRESEISPIDFFIISPNNVNLSSRLNNDLANENVIGKVHKGLFEKVMQGQSVFIPLSNFHTSLIDEASKKENVKRPTMFFAAPIINNNGNVIAVIANKIDFNGAFSSIFSSGFIGKSGETYALDKSGLLLSNIRFEDQLKEIGILKENSRSSLNIRISDPGKNLLGATEKTVQNKEWPLTLMAEHIKLGRTGKNIEGYRDYRGVEVVGHWLWDNELKLGIAAEVDVAESLELLTIFRYTIFAILFISLLLVFSGTLFTLKIGTRATKTLARSQHELEKLINERTQALEINVKRTRTIIDNASEGIIVINDKGIILEFSPAAEVIFEYRADEVLNKNIDLLMSESFHEKYLKNQASGTGKQSFYEIIGYRNNQELIDIEVAVGAVKIESEQLFTGIVRDSTLRKKAERELKSAKLKAEKATDLLADQVQFQQLLMDSVSLPLFYLDADARFKGFNKVYEETFGIKAKDFIGFKITELDYLPEEDRNKYLAESLEIINEQKTIRREIKLPFADGELHDALYWASGFKDSKDKPAGLVGNFIDVTKEKESARKLEIAMKSADEANHSKADFLANMSHEIRTPMNAIIGMSYLALQTDLNRKQLDYVNKIHSSANALLGIINDILDFSKIEAGKLEIEAVPFCLNQTIEHLVQIISHKSQEKKLELLVDFDPELPIHLIGDSLRLGQILINLANNAIKFTNTGEVIIKVKKLEHDEESVTLEFAVCDTGIGMNEEQLSRLFKSFSQADASTTRKYGGTGLGLTISKTLTELMNGTIWVESQYNEGSQFYFTATFGLANETDKVANNIPSATDLIGLPVLIVDDSVAAREILFNLADSLGFKPELAATGQEALEKLLTAERENNAFKLVLSDWQMPNMNGIALGEKISRDGFLLYPPKFVIVTAYDRDEMLKNAGNIKLASSMTKPVTASTLLNTTMKVMGQKVIDVDNNEVGLLDITATQGIIGAEILLVEDNEINQQIAVELLEMAGLVVTVASNGQFAVEAIENKKFDAVLMDIQMPVMDGYTATKEIRKNKKNASLPIIAMTANAMSGDREKCIAAGMNEHLSKPIDPQEMYKTIADWVESTGKTLNAMSTPKVVLKKSDLPNLPEFDLDKALARMAGNVKVYRNTLKKVVHSEANAIERIRDAINENDFHKAVLIAHTLKGVAANIGANFVIPSAEQLELLFTDKVELGKTIIHDEVEALLIECEAKLTQMIVTIENDQQPIETVKKPMNVDIHVITQLCLDLIEQINNFDSAASDSLDKVLSCLPVELLPAVAKELTSTLEGYDFERAEVLVLEFQKELNLMINNNHKNKENLTNE